MWPYTQWPGVGPTASTTLQRYTAPGSEELCPFPSSTDDCKQASYPDYSSGTLVYSTRSQSAETCTMALRGRRSGMAVLDGLGGPSYKTSVCDRVQYRTGILPVFSRHRPEACAADFMKIIRAYQPCPTTAQGESWSRPRSRDATSEGMSARL